ncbi:MAG: PBP1A family penicillin-binding protein, partial [Gemmatimonadota bacterium]|nr:PBP1A family penicillin-binding protein [Gemmatimonadota bacterium]
MPRPLLFRWTDLIRSIPRRCRADAARPARLWMRAYWRSLLVLVTALAGVASFDAWLGTCGFIGCPSTGDIQAFRPAEGSKVVDRNGLLIGRLEYVRRVNVPLARIPAHVRQAFIATEDRRFYQHHGVDWRSVVRAVARNVRSLGVREGFSTITMQVARNTFTRQHANERSLRRKLVELRVARLLERNLSKDQILELYLNVIYLGNGVYGVEAASRDLFGKSVDKLNVSEGAMLAALPKGPSTYTPRRDTDRAEARRDLVLTLMVREGYLREDRARRAAERPVRVADDEWRPTQVNSYAVDVVRAFVDSVLGSSAPDVGDVTVYTTLDARAQRSAERAVAAQAAQIQRESDWSGHARGDRVQGALIALDPRNGEMRAVVGGRDYERKGFNRAFGAHRQPGSAFKPFVYAAALSAGYSPASMVDDSPVQIDAPGLHWRPSNFGDEYFGRVTLRRALMHSANAATVRVSHAVGESRVADVAHLAGITSKLNPVPSIALGALEVTPLELVTAYATFANGGLRIRPTLIKRIEGADGALLWSAPLAAAPIRVLDARDAYQLTSMLESVVDEGTGRAVRQLGVDGLVAGKTGTTNNGADIWFVGYTPTLVAGVWFGFDTPKPISDDASGGRLAAPAWAKFYLSGWREP